MNPYSGLLPSTAAQPATSGAQRSLLNSATSTATGPATSTALRGRSERWGDVSPEVREAAKIQILMQTKHLPMEDRVLALSIAQLESGFNPSAKSKTSTASGLFQIIKRNFEHFKIAPHEHFSMQANIRVGLALLAESSARIRRQYPQAHGQQRAVLVYADYHDGPKRNLDGAAIARRDLLPLLAQNLRFVRRGG